MAVEIGMILFRDAPKMNAPIREHAAKKGRALGSNGPVDIV
jgi:hypothetical protein